MHSSYLLFRKSMFSLHFLIISTNLLKSQPYLFSFLQQSSSEEKANVAPMAIGFSFIAIELALRRNVFVNIFQTISPKPFFRTPYETFSIISPLASDQLNGESSMNLALSRNRLWVGKRCCKYGRETISQNNSQYTVCSHSTLEYSVISSNCLALTFSRSLPAYPDQTGAFSCYLYCFRYLHSDNRQNMNMTSSVLWLQYGSLLIILKQQFLHSVQVFLTRGRVTLLQSQPPMKKPRESLRTCSNSS